MCAFRISNDAPSPVQGEFLVSADAVAAGAPKSTSFLDRLTYAGWAAEQLNSHFIARAESSIAASSATRHLLRWVRLEFFQGLHSVQERLLAIGITA